MNTKKREFAEEVEALLRAGGEFEYLDESESFQFRTVEDFYYHYDSIEMAIDELVDYLHIDEKAENYLHNEYQLNI